MLFPPPRFQLEIVPECGSTSEVLLARRGEPGFHGAALMALKQTSGYGRRGRQWFSGEGNLALSLGIEYAGEGAEVALLPFLAGLAVHKVAAECLPAGADLRLKWPNDLYLDGKKLSGLISQGRQGLGRTEVVLGIGVNLRVTPPDLQDCTIALAAYGEPPAPEAFALVLLRELEYVFAQARDFAWLRERWEQAARLQDGLLYVVGEEGNVKGEELLPTGELLVTGAEGQPRKLASEEVSLRFAPQG